jgi:very-short-patch-repair endonuclease
MKTREAWKYVLLREVLTEKNISFEFEFMLPDASWVYDLGLLSMKLIVEFDGPEHKASRKQRCEDQERDNYARSLGWDVTRIPVLPKTVIDPTTVMEVIAKVNN